VTLVEPEPSVVDEPVALAVDDIADEVAELPELPLDAPVPLELSVLDADEELEPEVDSMLDMEPVDEAVALEERDAVAVDECGPVSDLDSLDEMPEALGEVAELVLSDPLLIVRSSLLVVLVSLPVVRDSGLVAVRELLRVVPPLSPVLDRALEPPLVCPPSWSTVASAPPSGSNG
jgi:hypothetical protein